MGACAICLAQRYGNATCAEWEYCGGLLPLWYYDTDSGRDHPHREVALQVIARSIIARWRNIHAALRVRYAIAHNDADSDVSGVTLASDT